MKSRFLDAKAVRRFLKQIPKSEMFSVTFQKKDGELRRMVCRRDVKKFLKGGESTIKEHKNLVGVWDTQIQEYRCFDLNRVISVRGHGSELRAVEGVGENEPIYDGFGKLVKSK